MSDRDDYDPNVTVLDPYDIEVPEKLPNERELYKQRRLEAERLRDAMLEKYDNEQTEEQRKRIKLWKKEKDKVPDIRYIDIYKNYKTEEEVNELRTYITDGYIIDHKQLALFKPNLERTKEFLIQCVDLCISFCKLDDTILKLYIYSQESVSIKENDSDIRSLIFGGEPIKKDDIDVILSKNLSENIKIDIENINETFTSILNNHPTVKKIIAILERIYQGKFIITDDYPFNKQCMSLLASYYDVEDIIHLEHRWVGDQYTRNIRLDNMQPDWINTNKVFPGIDFLANFIYYHIIGKEYKYHDYGNDKEISNGNDEETKEQAPTGNKKIAIASLKLIPDTNNEQDSSNTQPEQPKRKKVKIGLSIGELKKNTQPQGGSKRKSVRKRKSKRKSRKARKSRKKSHRAR